MSKRAAPIYDCNGKRLTNEKISFYAAIKPTEKVFLSIKNSVSNEELLEIHQQLKNS